MSTYYMLNLCRLCLYVSHTQEAHRPSIVLQLATCHRVVKAEHERVDGGDRGGGGGGHIIMVTTLMLEN